MKTKRIPIKAAKDISKLYDQEQVIIVTWDKINNTTHVVTYGKTIESCDQAAIGGNLVKKTLGFPERLCNAEPSRVKKLKDKIRELEDELRVAKKYIEII